MDCTMVIVKLDIHGSWVAQYPWYPWGMGCTMVMLAMTHGLYNTHSYHDPWGCTMPLVAMGHGLYNAHVGHALWVVQCSLLPCPMGYTIPMVAMGHRLYNACAGHGPWVI